MCEFNPDKLYGETKELWDSMNDEWKGRLSHFFDEILRIRHDELKCPTENDNKFIWDMLLMFGVADPCDNKFRK